MNLTNIEKHYDKLTARERFALMVKAGARSDDAQVKALKRTAPRKTFSYPNTSGLDDGFNFLIMFYVMSQLNDIASFYYLLLNDDGTHEEVTIAENESCKLSDVYWMMARNIIGARDAFGKICQEYGFEAGELMKDYPYQLTIGLGELAVMIGAQELTDEEKADLAKYTDETLQSYREAISKHSQGWE